MCQFNASRDYQCICIKLGRKKKKKETLRALRKMLNSLVGIRFHGKIHTQQTVLSNKIPSSKPMLNYLRRFQIIIYLLQDNFVSTNRCLKRNLRSSSSSLLLLLLYTFGLFSNNHKAFIHRNFPEIYYVQVSSFMVT